MSGFKQSVVFAEQGMDIGQFPNTTGERASIEFTEPNDELTLIVNNTSNNGTASACSVMRTSGGAGSNAFDRYIQTGVRAYAAGLNNNAQSFEIRGTTNDTASPQVGSRLLMFESNLTRGNFNDINVLRMGNTPNPGAQTVFNVLNLSGVADSASTTNLQVSAVNGGNAYHQYTGPGDNWFHGVNKTANNNAWELQTIQVGLFPNGNKVMVATTAGEVTFPLTPAFGAQLSAADANVTGAGTTYTIGTNVAFTEIFDQGGDFNTNGTFTAPVTGRYQLNGIISLTALTAAMTTGFLRVVTSNRIYTGLQLNVGVVRTVATTADTFGGSFSVLADMDAADTATLTVLVLGGAGDTAGLAIASNKFSGSLQC